MPNHLKSKKHYPTEFREKAVKLITELGYTLEQVAAKPLPSNFCLTDHLLKELFLEFYNDKPRI